MWISSKMFKQALYLMFIFQLLAYPAEATLTLTIPDTKVFFNNTAASSLPIGTGLTISAGPTDIFNTAKVYFISGFHSNQDSLTFTPELGISTSYDAATGVLSCSGSVPVSQYQALLRSVKYNNSNGQPASEPRVLCFFLGNSLYNPETGHYYEFVKKASAISWDAAKAEAATRYLFGLQGYLMTVTTPKETEFIIPQLQADGWIGASDKAEEGKWIWMTGPEAGQQFWQGGPDGSAVNGMYQNWYINEPNNQSGNEHYAHIWHTNADQWNDYPNSHPTCLGYLVEYGGVQNDPPTSLAGEVTILMHNNSAPAMGVNF